jgi:hypothetical protein
MGPKSTIRLPQIGASVVVVVVWGVKSVVMVQVRPMVVDRGIDDNVLDDVFVMWPGQGMPLLQHLSVNILSHL